jgi:hypothetical protein
VKIDYADGSGVMGNALVQMGAGNVPGIISQSAVVNEAGVTASALATSTTTLVLTVTGKTTTTNGNLTAIRCVA